MKKRLLSMSLLFILGTFLVFGVTSFLQPSRVLAAAPPAGQNRITSLYDAISSSQTLEKDWGYSALVEYNGKRILFDAGNNADIFKRNVKKLGLDLRTIDFAVLSHPHADHLSGFDYLVEVNPNVKLYLPADLHNLGAPSLFKFGGPDPNAAAALPPEERYFDTGATEVQLKPSGRYYKAKNVEYLRDNLTVAPGITIISTRSPYLGGFNGYPPKTPTDPALVGLPELSLALDTSQGEVLISGCSHTGIEAIIEATQKATGKSTYAALGGFHLFPYDATYITALANKVKNDLGVRIVSPAHCTGHLGFKIFKDFYKDNYLYGGLGSQFKFSA
ncbi:MBL fold metallo-hydrolase [Synechococcus elongatus IITB5]|uniref:MBL fold metallo-hydrolase n=2 Tax=Synechococcus elongatus TaxID=32046 RepID=UPI0030CFCB72